MCRILNTPAQSRRTCPHKGGITTHPPTHPILPAPQVLPYLMAHQQCSSTQPSRTHTASYSVFAATRLALFHSKPRAAAATHMPPNILGPAQLHRPPTTGPTQNAGRFLRTTHCPARPSTMLQDHKEAYAPGPLGRLADRPALTLHVVQLHIRCHVPMRHVSVLHTPPPTHEATAPRCSTATALWEHHKHALHARNGSVPIHTTSVLHDRNTCHDTRGTCPSVLHGHEEVLRVSGLQAEPHRHAAVRQHAAHHTRHALALAARRRARQHRVEQLAQQRQHRAWGRGDAWGRTARKNVVGSDLVDWNTAFRCPGAKQCTRSRCTIMWCWRAGCTGTELQRWCSWPVRMPGSQTTPSAGVRCLPVEDPWVCGDGCTQMRVAGCWTWPADNTMPSTRAVFAVRDPASLVQ